jgi:hypothetical protein
MYVVYLLFIAGEKILFMVDTTGSFML